MASPTLLSIFEPRKGYSPVSPAIIIPSTSGKQSDHVIFSYQRLQELVHGLQLQIAAFGFQSGQTVSSSLVNGIEFTVAFLATGAEQLIAAPLNPAYSKGEVLFYLQDTKSQLLILPSGSISSNTAAVQAAREINVPVVEITYDASERSIKLTRDNGQQVPRAAAVRMPSPDNTALVLHTSGTTGRPKGVPLNHRNLSRTMSNIIATYRLTPNDRTYLVMPLFHVHGLLCGLLATLLSGGSAVIPPKFSANAFWKQFIEERCNWYTAVPTIHQMLLSTAKPNPLPRIRFIRSCSSSLSPATFHAIEEAFQAPVLEAYAMTEAAHQMTSNPLPPAKRKPGSVGLGQGVEVKILDQTGKEVPQGKEGEVCVRGPNVTSGYLNNPKANEESFVKSPKENEGFFRTGDQGKKDEHGYIVLTGRIKELINRAGEKISPLEVDAALLAVQGVDEAVSFAVPDKTYGEKVGAAVVLKTGASITEEGIKQGLNGKLSKFKIPEQIFITARIPKTATGKIQRRNVAATFLKQGNAKL
ncbi:putative PCS60-AMP-binding protein, peroxisomal [Tilletiaria anomala UBC 951]|uniref:Putative PCS60-AMP-binding protein, peroxisomal n=1 Tax=Tilletiaria anomala (strain ATCC 24038 / CBS 436.72 / UBC 951) TaxID=1037660 RepID=A0A066WNK8_TILAU|nr:putative PCS60-AMP-binding protein, peroxisomal [Tilletiaria anomala UBC 951]KDN52589.1 putative PCS60-AMP-binding protein, peroxisomal [Tilletiaria anomala UBC 951]